MADRPEISRDAVEQFEARLRAQEAAARAIADAPCTCADTAAPPCLACRQRAALRERMP
ncbi:MAG TPA: hypothetical protein VKB54_20090 [Solirubrobacteraceae bacterium]|nr:hypothetical protein [Solirubrobacteraceae bacterium]